MSEAIELLAHYTTAAVAMEHVIPRGELRMSPYRHMRDPVENKYIQPGIQVPMGSPFPPTDISQGIWRQVKEVRDGCRVLSLTRDATDPDIPGDTFGACWSRPRMWEQYGDAHRGVCLVFDQRRLELAIRDAFQGPNTVYLGPVEYARSGIADTAADTLTGIDVHADAAAIRRWVEAYVEHNYKAFFFLKHDDFETEREFRALLTAAGDEYIHVAFHDALYAVILGERFPRWQIPGVVALCARQELQVLEIQWERGRPSVKRVEDA